MGEARTVLQVREARCCTVEDRFRIVEAHGVLAFLPLLCSICIVFFQGRIQDFGPRGAIISRGARKKNLEFFRPNL